MTPRDADTPRSSFSRPAIWLSVVAHIGLVYVLLNEELLWTKLQAIDLPAVEVELVAEPPKPAKPAVPPPEPKAEQPKPEQQKPEAAEPPKPPPPRSMPPQAAPQLMPGRLAEHSAVTHPAPRNGAGGSEANLAMATGPGITLLPKEQAKLGPSGSAGPEGPELTQSERVFILAQVMKYWKVDFHAPEAKGLVLQGVFYVLADGTLASPVNKDDPWNPSAVVDDYASLGPSGSSFRRDAIDGFLLALRLCQPLQLPSSKGAWPRKIVIRFAFDKL